MKRLEKKKRNFGKPLEWISRKNVNWREYRELNLMSKEELEGQR